MEKNNPRFYYALGALSLFALALFQGAQFFTSQYESQVLGWTSMFQNMPKTTTNTGLTLPNGQKFTMPAIPSMPAMPSLPAGFDMSQWKSLMGSGSAGVSAGNSDRTSIRTKLGLGKGISCTTALELFDTLCDDGSVTASEFKDAAQDYVGDLRDQAAALDPRGEQAGKNRLQTTPILPTTVNIEGGQTRGATPAGLSCDTIKSLLDAKTVCSDGNISREEIRTITSQLKPSGTRAQGNLTTTPAALKTCRFCGATCAFVTPNTNCTDQAPPTGTYCQVQNGNCVTVGGGL
jgi:hypothetical protein